MITRLYIDNYKCLVNFELRLGSLAFIMGPNGAGKSAVFDTLRLLGSFVNGIGETSALFPTGSLTRWDTRDVQTLEIDIEGNGGVYAYKLEVEHERDRRRCRIRTETLMFGGNPLYSAREDHAQLYRDDGSKGPEVIHDWFRSGLGIIQPRHDNKKLTWFKERMGNTWVVRIDPFAMASRSEEESDRPDVIFSNYASWYRHLLQDQPNQVFKLTEVLGKELLDGFDSFRLVADGQNARLLMVR